MASEILDTLDPYNEEFKESFVVFQQYYPKIGIVFFLKSIFLPLKWLAAPTPKLGQFRIILDCVNMEKYKRMKNLLPSDVKPLIYVSDLSTERSRLFCSGLGVDVEKISQKVRCQNYWKYLFIIIIQTISESTSFSQYFSLLTYKSKVIQELVQYDWILNSTGASTLFTANEDSWISAILALFCRKRKIKSVNVMHGRVYSTKQFYDISVVYGRTSAEATKKFTASHTQIQQHPLNEIEESKVTDHYEHHQKIVLFDQPLSEFYSKEMQLELYGLLESLVKKMGFTVSIKLHPAQSDQSELQNRPFEIFNGKSNQEILLQTGIAISICSTVAMEVISSGVPMVYFNYERLLDRFIQIKFLSSSSPKNIGEVESLVLKLQKKDFYDQFQKQQNIILNSEYAVSIKNELIIL